MERHVCVAHFSKVVDENSESYLVRFPDLNGCLSDGKTLSEALERAIDACACWMLLADDIPEPNLTLIEQSNSNLDEFYNLLFVDLEEYGKKVSMKSVKKNVTIPSWLNERAEKENINFSQILQKGVREALGMVPHALFFALLTIPINILYIN